MPINHASVSHTVTDTAASWAAGRVAGLVRTALFVVAFGLAAAAGAQTCIDDVTNRSNNCTANDVQLTLLASELLINSCISNSDTTEILFRAQLTPGSPDRFDIGIFVATDGGDAFTGACQHELLSPVAVPPGHDPVSGSGPFANLDGDVCGDVVGGEVNLYDLPPITIPCTDRDNDGFLDIGNCTSWDNKSRNDCTGLAQAVPGTKSKCGCGVLNTQVGVANLGLTKSCVTDTIRPGGFVHCVVSYTNTGGGPGDHISFVDDYPQNVGGISAITVSGAGDTVTDDGDVLVWTPGGAPAALGNVPADTGGTLEYNFTLDNDPALFGSTFCNTVTAHSQGVAEALSATECTNVSATAAFVGTPRVWADGGRTIVEWETFDESGSAAFVLERRGVDGSFVAVDPLPVPALAAPLGGRYRVVDPGSTAAAVTYRLRELERDGNERLHGPFTVVPASSPAVSGPTLDTPLRQARRPPPRAKRPPAAGARPSLAAARPAADARLAIRVREDGLYRLSPVTIASALGRPVTEIEQALRRGRLALEEGGVEVAWTRDGDDLLFYGRGIDSLFTRDNVYWLALAKGREMAVDAGAPPPLGGESRHFRDRVDVERDVVPALTGPFEPEDDYWIWAFLNGLPGARVELPFAVDGVAPAGAPATLELRLVGFESGAENHVAVALGGQPLGEARWSGDAAHEAVFELPPGGLADGANVLELHPVLDAGGSFFNVLVDGFAVTYPRRFRAVDDRLLLRGDGHATVTVDGFGGPDLALFDLADPRRPRRVEAIAVTPSAGGGWRLRFAPASPERPYLATRLGATRAPRSLAARASRDLRATDNAAGYLVIAAADLAAAAGVLAEHRATVSRPAMVVTVEEVMDVFNHGVYDPRSLRDFLAHAHLTWRVPPRFVLLAGNGTLDYRDLLGAGDNLVPTLLRRSEHGLFASDNRLADVDDDGVPDLAIGRVPARDTTELEGYVDKVLAAEALGPPPRRALLVADDADGGGDFARDSDELATRIAPGYDVERAYLGALLDVAATRAAVLQGFADGVGLIGYLGHGNALFWAAEQLLGPADVAALDNERLPLVAALTCNVGRFEVPGFRPLAGELVLHPGGGASAVLGASGLVQNHRSKALGEHLLRALFARGESVVGDALLAVWADFARTSDSEDTLESYVLFGDPAIAVR